MNQQLQTYARETLKEGLAKLPEEWQMVFKRIYSHDHLDWSIEKVVDNMEVEKLDWAMTQVSNSVKNSVNLYKLRRLLTHDDE
jgi:hypothetical protein